MIDGIGEADRPYLGRASGTGLELLEESPVSSTPDQECSGNGWPCISASLSSTPARVRWSWLPYGGLKREFCCRKLVDLLFPILDKRGGMIGKDAPPFRVEPEIARLRCEDVSGLESLFGPRRSPEEPPTLARFADIAASLQRQTSSRRCLHSPMAGCLEQLKNVLSRFRRRTGGSIASSGTQSARREGQHFRSLFVPCAAEHAGTAIGAAARRAGYETERPLKKSEPTGHGFIPRSWVRSIGLPRLNQPLCRGATRFQKVVDHVPAWRRLGSTVRVSGRVVSRIE